MDFTALVDSHYKGLYQFACSLAHSEADASDLTQETFLRWAQKGSQLREAAKAKSWLFTTLYRLFLNRRRHLTRFPQDDLGEAENRLPPIQSDAVRSLEASEVMGALREIDETFRAPLVLFYLEDHSYHEIAAILDIPEGTVMSRLWRGKALLRDKLKDRPAVQPAGNIIPMQTPKRKEARS
ncbi:MAG: polymerase, sigma-24 subunit, subfamily [Verrucomicrobiales bacterium]|nr:polymerase, sigma-24 subunit, subfamily [Verrucomicrobiales bacterium]